MIGELYRDGSSSAVEMMFSVQTSDQLVNSFQSSVAVPPNVNSRRRLCIHPSGNQEAQKCSLLNYEVEVSFLKTLLLATKLILCCFSQCGHPTLCATIGWTLQLRVKAATREVWTVSSRV